MNNTLKQIIEMKTAFLVNTFLYYFRKLWVIGKWIPESLYGSYQTKKVLSIISLILQQAAEFIAKPVYLFLFTGLPLLFLKNGQRLPDGQEFTALTHMLFFLSCYMGAFGDSLIFNVTRDKITFIKYMHTSARKYTQSALAFRYIPFFLYYLICLPAAALLCHRPVWEGFAAWLMFSCFRMAGEAWHLFFFDKTEKVLSRNMFYEWFLIGTGFVLAYYLPYRGWLLPSSLLFHPAAILCYLLLGGFCTYYITVGYQGYDKKLPRSIDLNYLMSNIMSNASGSSFKEVEIKEKDLNVSKKAGKDFQNLRGYAYFNALFFARHRRQLLRPVYYRLLMVGLAFAVALFFYQGQPEAAVHLSRNLSASLLPSSVFIMYCMTVADKACKAMFYNCDKDMLHYAFYRSPQTILKNFNLRLCRISLFNGAVAFAICLAATGFCFLCGTSIFTLDFLLFCVTILLLSVLFTAHHLCLYYIFQPYSENLKIKNPFFSVINVIMYLLCFLCLQLETGGLVFSMAVLLFTVLYILIALVLVYYRAPRTFRVK
jgi:hypothetical protein